MNKLKKQLKTVTTFEYLLGGVMLGCLGLTFLGGPTKWYTLAIWIVATLMAYTAMIKTRIQFDIYKDNMNQTPDPKEMERLTQYKKDLYEKGFRNGYAKCYTEHVADDVDKV